MYDDRDHNFDMCEKCMRADIYIAERAFEHHWKNSKYGHTFKAYVGEDLTSTFFAEAGCNPSAHTDNEQYYGHRVEPGSVHGREALHLKMVCWMDPWCVVEGIKQAEDVYIDIHHVYGHDFDVSNTCHISFADADEMGDHIDKSKFEHAHEFDFPPHGFEEKPRGIVLKEALGE